MKEYRVVFKELIKHTDFTWSFRFDSEESIDFIPGQFLQIIFDEENLSNRELNKYLSFSSASGESYIEVTKRLSESVFSQRLRELKQGDSVKIKAPMGNCVLGTDIKKVLFLVGGIGITPVMSILRTIAGNGGGVDICLLYCNRDIDDIVFKNEIDKYCEESGNIKSFYSVDRGRPVDDMSLVGFICDDMLKKCVDDYHERNIFIFGPPMMVQATEKVCESLQCNKELIKKEKFVGY